MSAATALPARRSPLPTHVSRANHRDFPPSERERHLRMCADLFAMRVLACRLYRRLPGSMLIRVCSTRHKEAPMLNDTAGWRRHTRATGGIRFARTGLLLPLAGLLRLTLGDRADVRHAPASHPEESFPLPLCFKNRESRQGESEKTSADGMLRPRVGFNSFCYRTCVRNTALRSPMHGNSRARSSEAARRAASPNASSRTSQASTTMIVLLATRAASRISAGASRAA